MRNEGGTPEPTEGWRAVAPEPSGEANTPMPTWVKAVLAVGLAVLLLTGALIGSLLGAGQSRAPETPGTPEETHPAFALEAPLVVDELVRGRVSESTGPAPANVRIVQADYTDGEDTVVFILSWPAPSASEFVQHAGIEAAGETPVDSGRYCGVSEDTGQSACGEVIDDVGVLLVSVSEQSETAVAQTLDLFKEAIGQ